MNVPHVLREIYLLQPFFIQKKKKGGGVFELARIFLWRKKQESINVFFSEIVFMNLFQGIKGRKDIEWIDVIF